MAPLRIPSRLIKVIGSYSMWLNRYRKGNYSPGRPIAAQLAWYYIGSPIVKSGLLPFSSLKRAILRAFGARVGMGAVIKPGVKIKFPWRLSIGEYAWIGEECWIDNLAHVDIGAHACVSQGSYLCTGDHDRKSPFFDLRPRSITLGAHSWIGAKCIVSPGSIVPEGTTLALGSVWKGVGKPWHVYQGVPAIPLKPRERTNTEVGSRILLVNQNFYPDQSATAQYLTDLALELTKQGHQVTVVASRFGYLRNRETYSTRETWRDISIVRIGMMSPRKDSTILRMVSALCMHISFAAAFMRLPRFDSVLVLTSPPLIAWIALLCLKKPRQRFCHWVMDLNPDQAVAAGLIKEKSVPGRLLFAASERILRKSDRVITLDRHMTETLLRRRASADRIHEIPLWVDTREIQPIEPARNPFIEQHGLAGKFIVMYSGNISPCHPLQAVIQAAEALREDSSTLFVFIGDGAAASGLRRDVDDRKLNNVVFLPYQEREKLSYSLSAADLHIISQGSQYVGMVHPSKVYAVLGVEKPILYLGPEESFIDETFVRHGVGKRVADGDGTAICRYIQEYKTQSLSERRMLQQHIKDCALPFTKDTIVPKLVRCITGIGE